MKKTIKIIDLIVKIANKGEVPKKINYDGLTYIFDIAENDYISEKADYYDGDYLTHKYLTESFEFDILNNEVEILDEDKEIEKIEKIHRSINEKYIGWSCEEKVIIKDIIRLQDKMDEIIDKLNKE